MEQLSVLAGVIGRKLEITDAQKQYMVESLRHWPDGPVTVTIKRERAGKSSLQMGYYRGLILPMIVEEMCGSPDDEECKRTAHLKLKAMFLPPTRVEFVNPETGEEIHRDVVPSLADLNTKEMADFTERVIEWAQGFFGITVPPPDPAWRSKRKESLGTKGAYGNQNERQENTV